MKIKKSNEDFSELTTCKACRGMGGRYIYAKAKNREQNTSVVFEPCSVCEGKGKVVDTRTREEKLDDWQNETNLWINCEDCDADGYIIDEDGNEVVCQACEGYGVIKDKRTPEEKEVERIEEEKQKFKDALNTLLCEDEIDFYGDNKEKQQIRFFEEEIATLKESVKKLEESNSSKITTILHEVKESSKTLAWISIAALILVFMQCSGKNDEKIKDGVKKIRDDIESLESSIDKVNDRVKELDNKLDNFNYKKPWY